MKQLKLNNMKNTIIEVGFAVNNKTGEEFWVVMEGGKILHQSKTEEEANAFYEDYIKDKNIIHEESIYDRKLGEKDIN